MDRGQIQIGTLLNVEALTAEEGANGYSNTHIKEVELNGNGDADQRYERFGNATVQVSIEKQALENQTSGISLTDTIHDFAEQLETLLKASS